MLNYPFEASLEVEKDRQTNVTAPERKEEPIKFQIILDKTGWPDAHVTSVSNRI
jgi:hypothetical protein